MSICMLLWVNDMQIGHQKDAYRAANSWFLLNNMCFPLGLSPVLHPASLLIFFYFASFETLFLGCFSGKTFYIRRDVGQHVSYFPGAECITLPGPTVFQTLINHALTV